MRKISALIFVLLLFPSIAIGQTMNRVTITPKKVTYTRKVIKPGEPKRTFTVRYPIIGGTINPSVKSKLEKMLNYWTAFENSQGSLKDTLNDDTGVLNSLDYKINYNKNGILDVSLTQEISVMYPTIETVNLIINLKTGERVTFAEVFKSDALAALAAMTDKKLQAEKREIERQIDRGDFGTDAETKISAGEIIADLRFTVDDFKEFSVSDSGVTILYDAGFPHVSAALEPAGRYFFSYAELKPFIESDSILGKFVR